MQQMPSYRPPVPHWLFALLLGMAGGVLGFFVGCWLGINYANALHPPEADGLTGLGQVIIWAPAGAIVGALVSGLLGATRLPRALLISVLALGYAVVIVHTLWHWF